MGPASRSTCANIKPATKSYTGKSIPGRRLLEANKLQKLEDALVNILKVKVKVKVKVKLLECMAPVEHAFTADCCAELATSMKMGFHF